LKGTTSDNQVLMRELKDIKYKSLENDIKLISQHKLKREKVISW
jgi:hypothetical protein